MPFPNQPALDTYTRPDENPLSYGGRYVAAFGLSALILNANTCRRGASSGAMRWNCGDTTSEDCEGYLKFNPSTLDAGGGLIKLMLRLQNPGAGSSEQCVQIDYLPQGVDYGDILAYLVIGGVKTQLDHTGGAGGVRGMGVALSTNTLTLYRFTGSIWQLGTSGTVSGVTVRGPGQLGLGIESTLPSVTEFGGGPVGSTPIGGGGDPGAAGALYDRGVAKGILRGVTPGANTA